MEKSSIRWLKILEVSVWGLFLLFSLYVLNGYLQDKELLFFENKQKQVILGSSWGKSLKEVARICDFNLVGSNIAKFNKMYLDGKPIIFKDDLISVMYGVPYKVKNDTITIDYYFFDDQLIKILLGGRKEEINDFKNLVIRKYGKLTDNCETIDCSASLYKMNRKEYAKAFGCRYECNDTKDILIDYIEFYDINIKDSIFSIDLVYKPLVKELKMRKQYIAPE